MNDVTYQIKAISERLKREYHAQRIFLYGSYAKGEATEDSDIDLFILAPTTERFFDRMATVKRLIRDLRSGLPVAPIVLTEEELKKRIEVNDQFIAGIFEEGVEL